MSESTDLVRLAPTSPATRDARLALQDASLDEIKEIRDRAAAAEAYARAKDRRDAYLEAGEIRLWAERQAGAIRKAMPRVLGQEKPRKFDREEARRLREQGLTQDEVGRRLGVRGTSISKAERDNWPDVRRSMTIKKFDESLGVSSNIASNWEKLSEIPDERFGELIEEAKRTDSALTAPAIIGRDGRGYLQRVEPGIARLRDGRLVIHWRRDGVARRRTLATADISSARRELARARGTIKEPPVRFGRTIGDGYALVRRALSTLDRLDRAELDSRQRESVDRAFAHLHRAEDELVMASSLARTGRRPGPQGPRPTPSRFKKSGARA